LSLVIVWRALKKLFVQKMQISLPLQ
jgi:hypothetical protein